MPDPSPSNADSLKLQLFTARKEWWPAIVDSLPLGGYMSTLWYTLRWQASNPQPSDC